MIYGVRFSSQDGARFVPVKLKGREGDESGKARFMFMKARARLAMTRNRAVAFVAISETGAAMTLDRAAS